MNQIRFYFVLLSIVLLQAIPVKVLAASLEGRVLQNGNPIAGMEVRLYHPRFEKSVIGYSNRRGEFNFEHLPTLDGYTDIEYHWRGKLIYRDNIKINGEIKLLDTNL